jgi:hypothetical protein
MSLRYRSHQLLRLAVIYIRQFCQGSSGFSRLHDFDALSALLLLLLLLLLLPPLQEPEGESGHKQQARSAAYSHAGDLAC